MPGVMPCHTPASRSNGFDLVEPGAMNDRVAYSIVRYAWRRILCPVILLLVVASCNGQVRTSPSGDPAKITRATIVRTKGISSGAVMCALQDKDGDLWFRIDGEGAYRFDGTSFVNFTTTDGLCSDKVSAIIQDKDGRYLFGTDKGICVYDGKSFSDHPATKTLHDAGITCLLEDTDGNLWFGTKAHGVYRYDGTKLTNFLNGGTYNLGARSQLILDMLQDRKGNIWFSSWNGGGVWKFDGASFTNFLPSADYYASNQDKRDITRGQVVTNYARAENGITDDMIFSIMEDRAGNIWFATRDHGACRYDGRTFTSFWKNEDLMSRGAYAVLEDRNGNLWFTTEKDGVWRYDGKSIRNFTEKDGLVDDAVMSALEDKDGNLWFGTKWFGLSRYDGEAFTTFSREEAGNRAHQDVPSTSVPSMRCSSVCSVLSSIVSVPPYIAGWP